MLSKKLADSSGSTPARLAFVQLFVHLCLVFLLAGTPVPDINESHYLTKAKHAWDGSFAPGDLFLDSHDSHWLATTLAGGLARVLPLAAVAWLGRIVCWSLLVYSWRSLAISLGISSMLSPLALGAWYLATSYGNWAGEWAVGGFEAKSLAYPFILLGIARAIECRWQSAWVLFGTAVAFHPVAGGWAGLSVGILWLFQPKLKQRLRAEFLYLLAGTAIGLVGVVPAIVGLTGPNRVGNIVASQIHVYLRLPHHLCPRLFAIERHVAAAVSLTALAAATLLAKRVSSKELWHIPTKYSGAIPGLILKIAWVSVGFSLLGLCIDLLFSGPRPALASSWLRFYWFRWSDVAVPLAVTLTVFRWISLQILPKREALVQPTIGQRTLAWGTLSIAVLCNVGQIHHNWQMTVPIADRLVVNSVGPIQVSTARYQDWLAACRWIRENSPEDSLWFTPKYQQTFKWHTGRAEVVCWKDVPQDNRSVHEWYRRITRCDPPRDAQGKTREWTTEELLELSREFKFEWILLDRTIQKSPPRFEILYPLNESGRYIDQRSFVVLRVSKHQLESD
ncbi:MAG: hypothetical protein KDB22_11945 [Planctomycetales bacterium]|nr:hypothetical protein [Planctomycetales bacterium]